MGDALAEAALAEMRPLCRAAERWAGLGTHARDALVSSCGSYGHEPAARASMRRLRMGAPFLMAPFVRGMYTG